jgi:hypothetical protein
MKLGGSSLGIMRLRPVADEDLTILAEAKLFEIFGLAPP